MDTPVLVINLWLIEELEAIEIRGLEEPPQRLDDNDNRYRFEEIFEEFNIREPEYS